MVKGSEINEKIPKTLPSWPGKRQIFGLLAYTVSQVRLGAFLFNLTMRSPPMQISCCLNHSRVYNNWENRSIWDGDWVSPPISEVVPLLLDAFPRSFDVLVSVYKCSLALPESPPKVSCKTIVFLSVYRLRLYLNFCSAKYPHDKTFGGRVT